jgi:hypothetical protein
MFRWFARSTAKAKADFADFVDGLIAAQFPISTGSPVEAASVRAEQDRAVAIKRLQDARRRHDSRDIHSHTEAAKRLTTAALRVEVAG